MTTALIRTRSRSGQAGQIKEGNRMDLESFAAAAGLHPEFVLRLVSLGLIEAGAGSAQQGRLEGRSVQQGRLEGRPGQDPAQDPTEAGRIQRQSRGSVQGATGELWFSQRTFSASLVQIRLKLFAPLGVVFDL